MLELALIGFGALLLLVSVMMAWEARRLRSEGIRVEGTVVRVETERRVSADRLRYVDHNTPIFKFQDQQGKTWETAVDGTTGKEEVGSRAEIVYDPADPMTAMRPTITQYLFALGLFAGSVVLVALGVLLGGGV